MIDEAAFHHAVAAAIRAPSLHNSQPWRFRLQKGVCEVLADHSRLLSASDPTGWATRIACGAATFNMRLAFAVLGRPVDVRPEAFSGRTRTDGRKDRGRHPAGHALGAEPVRRDPAAAQQPAAILATAGPGFCGSDPSRGGGPRRVGLVGAGDGNGTGGCGSGDRQRSQPRPEPQRGVRR